MTHGSADAGVVTPRSTFYEHGRFGRMFPTLPPFSADTPSIRHALNELGKPGGLMDAGDGSDPVTLITDAAQSVHNPNNSELTAGMTFLGQFLDHDMTFDPTSSLARRQDPESIRNFRIPALDLDSVYGGGPGISPHLYDRTVDHGATTFLVEQIPGSDAVSLGGGIRYDLPRNRQNVALVGDPRNDENLVVSQLHLAVLRFHNAVVSDVRDELGGILTVEEVFAESQRIVRWHYQWMVVHEFLPKTVGQEMVTDILTNGRRFYRWRNDPFIPVEFSVAAYRFGHSQVRPSYRANFGMSTTEVSEQFIALIFDPAAADALDPDDLRGGCRAARRFIDWQTFFDFGDGQVKPNKKIDTTISTPLFTLMGQATGTPASLAQRNLLRGLRMRMPSGQSVAKAMSATPLNRDQLADVAPLGLDQRTPLWFYILREADVTAAGKHLGPVGGRMVGEVFLGLIDGDSDSYLSQDPTWTPTYGTAGDFTMADLLHKAGVVADLGT